MVKLNKLVVVVACCVACLTALFPWFCITILLPLHQEGRGLTYNEITSVRYSDKASQHGWS